MRRRLAVLVAALGLAAGAALAQGVAEPDSYRVEEYRAPVPETLAGAVVVDDDAAHALWRTGRVAFIDVLPQPPKPKELPQDALWIEKERVSVPGAMWLPNTGYGEISQASQDYLRDGLARATGGDTDAPVLFFCLADCWMSWNAARRAQEYGYTRVFWYPDGTDGWEAAGFPLEPVTRQPGG